MVYKLGGLWLFTHNDQHPTFFFEHARVARHTPPSPCTKLGPSEYQPESAKRGAFLSVRLFSDINHPVYEDAELMVGKNGPAARAPARETFSLKTGVVWLMTRCPRLEAKLTSRID